jgi:hypothetical protein
MLNVRSRADTLPGDARPTGAAPPGLVMRMYNLIDMLDVISNSVWHTVILLYGKTAIL